MKSLNWRLPLFVGCLAAVSLLGADWPRFRGPNGTGVAEATNLPATWSESENLLWKTELPGPGTSSPIISGDNVFVTCYTGYGVERGSAAGEQADLRRVLLCINRTSGDIKWSKEVDPVLPEDRYDGFITDHGYASSTPATDGEMVYVFFGKTGVLAFDFDGNKVWQKSVGDGSGYRGWGSAASPVVYQDMVIINASAEGRAIVALNKKTGDEVWKAEADALEGSWATPVIATDSEGNEEIIVTAPFEVWALYPKDGALKWFAAAADRAPVCPSVVAADGVVYVCGSRGGGMKAIRAGGADDVSESHTIWEKPISSYVPSPIVHGSHVYLVNESGVAYCLDRESGEELHGDRMEGAPGRNGVYASPVLADGKIIAVTRRNGTFVLSADEKMEQLALNKFESDDTDFNASPAVADGQILLRSNRYLYCVGQQ